MSREIEVVGDDEPEVLVGGRVVYGDGPVDERGGEWSASDAKGWWDEGHRLCFRASSADLHLPGSAPVCDDG